MYITIIFKHLLLNRLANQAQISCGASLGRGTKVYINFIGHMTKMAAKPIYGKNLKISRTRNPLILKLGMQHLLMKNMTSGGCLLLPRGYIHVHNYYFLTSSSLNSTANIKVVRGSLWSCSVNKLSHIPKLQSVSAVYRNQ